MLDENKDVKEVKDEGSKGSEVTVESLSRAIKEMGEANAAAIESMKTSTASTVSVLKQQIQERDGDIQNLTNLLGGLANDSNAGEEEETEITKDSVKKIIADSKQEDVDNATKESKAHWKEYGEIATELLEEEGPDGKPLSQDARDGIKKLMVDTGGSMTKNATKDAYRDFKKASKVYFGLDKEHGFKGGNTAGTGGGGGNSNTSSKKTYTLTPEAKAELKAMGETEEWGIEILEKRDKERQAAMV